MVSSAKTPRKKGKIPQKNNPLSKQAEQQSSLYEPKIPLPSSHAIALAENGPAC